MYSVEEAGNCLYLPSVFSISRPLNELVIAMCAYVRLISVAISKGEWRPLLNTWQMYSVELWYKHRFNFNYNSAGDF